MLLKRLEVVAHLFSYNDENDYCHGIFTYPSQRTCDSHALSAISSQSADLKASRPLAPCWSTEEYQFEKFSLEASQPTVA